MLKNQKYCVYLLVFMMLVQFIPKMVIAEGEAEGSKEAGESPRVITVAGSANVMVVPDEVVITVGIETFDKDINTAKRMNLERSDKVSEKARSFMIDSKNIQSDYLAIDQRYSYQGEEKALLGYDVRKRVVITLKDMTKFEGLISALLEAGVTNIYGTEFRTSELRKYKDEARIQAVRAAKEKASAMVGELGGEIGRACTVEEEQDNVYSSYRSWWGSYGAGNMLSNSVINTGSNDTTPIEGVEPGQIAVRAGVKITFEIK